MSIPDQPSGKDGNSQVTNKVARRSKFATASLVIGILDIPVLCCGSVLALTAVIAGAEGQGGTMVILGFSLFVLLSIIWLAGIVVGIIGLWSSRRTIAIIGIILSVLSPLVVYGILRLLNSP